MAVSQHQHEQAFWLREQLIRDTTQWDSVYLSRGLSGKADANGVAVTLSGTAGEYLTSVKLGNGKEAEQALKLDGSNPVKLIYTGLDTAKEGFQLTVKPSAESGITDAALTVQSVEYVTLHTLTVRCTDKQWNNPVSVNGVQVDTNNDSKTGTAGALDGEDAVITVRNIPNGDAWDYVQKMTVDGKTVKLTPTDAEGKAYSYTLESVSGDHSIIVTYGYISELTEPEKPSVETKEIATTITEDKTTATVSANTEEISAVLQGETAVGITSAKADNITLGQEVVSALRGGGEQAGDNGTVAVITTKNVTVEAPAEMFAHAVGSGETGEKVTLQTEKIAENSVKDNEKTRSVAAEAGAVKGAVSVTLVDGSNQEITVEVAPKKPITIRTFIEKHLIKSLLHIGYISGGSLVYDDTVQLLDYDGSSGELAFTTTHYTTFVFVSGNPAWNFNSGLDGWKQGYGWNYGAEETTFSYDADNQRLKISAVDYTKQTEEDHKKDAGKLSVTFEAEEPFELAEAANCLRLRLGGSQSARDLTARLTLKPDKDNEDELVHEAERLVYFDTDTNILFPKLEAGTEIGSITLDLYSASYKGDLWIEDIRFANIETCKLKLSTSGAEWLNIFQVNGQKISVNNDRKRAEVLVEAGSDVTVTVNRRPDSDQYWLTALTVDDKSIPIEQDILTIPFQAIDKAHSVRTTISYKSGELTPGDTPVPPPWTFDKGTQGWSCPDWGPWNLFRQPTFVWDAEKAALKLTVDYTYRIETEKGGTVTLLYQNENSFELKGENYLSLKIAFSDVWLAEKCGMEVEVSAKNGDKEVISESKSVVIFSEDNEWEDGDKIPVYIGFPWGWGVYGKITEISLKIGSKDYEGDIWIDDIQFGKAMNFITSRTVPEDASTWAGTIDPLGDVPVVKPWEGMTFTVRPLQVDQRIAWVKVDGKQIEDIGEGPNYSYTFYNPEEDHKIEAAFEWFDPNAAVSPNKGIVSDAGVIIPETERYVTVETEMDGNAVSASVSAELLKQIVEEAARRTDSVVTSQITLAFDAENPDAETKRTEMKVPAASLAGMAEKLDASLRIEGPVASVTVDAQGVTALGAKDGTVSFIAEQVDGTIAISVLADGERLPFVPGGIRAEVPCGCGPSIVAVLLPEPGTILHCSIADEDGENMLFTLPGSAAVRFVENEKAFSDVPADSWAKSAVDFVSSHEIFNGVGEGCFDPNTGMSRAMLVQVLYNVDSNPASGTDATFQDVAEDAWYADALGWAVEQEVIRGFADGSFGPDQVLTRQDAAVILYRYSGADGTADADLGKYADTGEIGEYAVEALGWAVQNGIIRGISDDLLDPGGTLTRHQAARLMMNYVAWAVQ